jgi:hypothetical protein
MSAGCINYSIRLLKNAHLRRFPLPSSLRRTLKYASLLRISGALHLCIFDQPAENNFFNNLLLDGSHFIAQRSNPLNPHLDHIPDLHRPDSFRRTGGNYISGQQRHYP